MHIHPLDYPENQNTRDKLEALENRYGDAVLEYQTLDQTSKTICISFSKVAFEYDGRKGQVLITPWQVIGAYAPTAQYDTYSATLNEILDTYLNQYQCRP